MAERIPPRPYAADTKIAVEKSEGELKAMLRKFGADQIGIVEDFGGNRAVAVQFRYDNRYIRQVFPLPKVNDYWVQHYESGRRRWDTDKQRAAIEQLTRARWRWIVDWTRMRLEAVENGETFGDVFLAQHVLADGRTMGEASAAIIEEIYRTGGQLQLGVAPASRMLPRGGE